MWLNCTFWWPKFGSKVASMSSTPCKLERWDKLLAGISVPEFTSYHVTAPSLVPDPMLLGTGPKYPPIQQVTENRGFDQIKKFFHRYTQESKHSFRRIKKFGVRCTLSQRTSVKWNIQSFIISPTHPKSMVMRQPLIYVLLTVKGKFIAVS